MNKPKIHVYQCTERFFDVKNCTRLYIKNTGVGTAGFQVNGDNSFFPLEECKEVLIYDNPNYAYSGRINVRYDDNNNGAVTFLSNEIHK